MKELQQFFNLKSSEVEHILEFSHERKCTKGEILFYDHELVDHLYFLAEGTVMAYQVDNENRKVVWHIFQAPCLIGEGFLLRDKPMPTVITTEWIRDGKVIKIDFKRFERYYMNRADILYIMLKSVSAKLSNYTHFVLNEKFFNCGEKIAFFITHHPALVQDLKLGEISSLLNIQQPTLSKILKQFRNDGLIEDKKFKIIIKDEQRLRELFQNKL